MQQLAGNYTTLARKFYAALIKPIRQHLQGKRHLLICPEGYLLCLPFQALQDENGKFLLEDYEISYSYSATAAKIALAAKSKEAPAQPDATMLAVGDLTHPTGFAPLPGIRREVTALRDLFKDIKVLTKEDAQKGIVKQEIGKYRYLHFATHGIFSETAPMLSGLVLSKPVIGSTDDSLLTARDISDLNLKAELVVLSACNTARGERYSGEGVRGLTWALSAAGAQAQVVSQWSVNDNSTAELMHVFYARLKHGMAKGQALREACLELLKQNRSSQETVRGTGIVGDTNVLPQEGMTREAAQSHPYYWGPFILLGNWN